MVLCRLSEGLTLYVIVTACAPRANSLTILERRLRSPCLERTLTVADTVRLVLCLIYFILDSVFCFAEQEKAIHIIPTPACRMVCTPVGAVQNPGSWLVPTMLCYAFRQREHLRESSGFPRSVSTK